MKFIEKTVDFYDLNDKLMQAFKQKDKAVKVLDISLEVNLNTYMSKPVKLIEEMKKYSTATSAAKDNIYIGNKSLDQDKKKNERPKSAVQSVKHRGRILKPSPIKFDTKLRSKRDPTPFEISNFLEHRHDKFIDLPKLSVKQNQKSKSFTQNNTSLKSTPRNPLDAALHKLERL